MYDTINDFFCATGICHRDQDKWRLTKPCYGSINGLDYFTGCVVATNGILCYLETSAGQTIGPCHLDWFVKNDREELQTEDGEVILPSRNKKQKIIINDLIKLIQA